MDRFIKSFPAVRDGDLMLCEAEGVAYQADMRAGRVQYDADYMAKVQAYEGTAIAKAVNAGRCALLSRHIKAGTWLLDYGAGSGAFVRDAAAAGFKAFGYDVIMLAKKRLFEAGHYADDPAGFDAVTLWDTIEHMEVPGDLLRQIPRGAKLFVSLPVFDDLRNIRASRHYRPGEHLYYWTAAGFIGWMELYGFRLLEQSSHEVDAGRESIGAFAFCRDVKQQLMVAA